MKMDILGGGVCMNKSTAERRVWSSSVVPTAGKDAEEQAEGEAGSKCTNSEVLLDLGSSLGAATLTLAV